MRCPWHCARKHKRTCSHITVPLPQWERRIMAIIMIMTYKNGSLCFHHVKVACHEQQSTQEEQRSDGRKDFHRVCRESFFATFKRSKAVRRGLLIKEKSKTLSASCLCFLWASDKGWTISDLSRLHHDSSGFIGQRNVTNLSRVEEPFPHLAKSGATRVCVQGLCRKPQSRRPSTSLQSVSTGSYGPSRFFNVELPSMEISGVYHFSQ